MFLLDVIKSNPAYSELILALQKGKHLPGLALPRAARLPLLAAIYSDLCCPILLIADRADHALALMDELVFWLPDVPRQYFAEPAPLFYEEASWGNTIKLQRLEVLTKLSAYHLPFNEKPAIPPIIITSPRALMTRTISRREYLKSMRVLSKGGEFHPEFRRGAALRRPAGRKT